MTLACISMHSYFLCGTPDIETLSLIALVLPAAYHSSKWKDQIPFGNGEEITKELLTSFSGSDGVTPVRDPAKSGLLTISRGTAILLLFVYVAYLFFQVTKLHHKQTRQILNLCL